MASIAQEVDGVESGNNLVYMFILFLIRELSTFHRIGNPSKIAPDCFRVPRNHSKQVKFGRNKLQ